ncbi:MAG: tRNA (adenosine(37)-N6)-dimethylallyltransferase MiaA [Peptostreptococcaceae bacterium]|nr:tRNA (adenosine(37)-N6)-dimethylallyltransferase MiaA [Peptostreptococcaceae bacterium]
MNKIIIIAGPTAVGKTGYAIELAEAFETEIISADSMQVYKYMDIGTAKPTIDELSRVKHHMIDVADPLENDYSVALYKEQAEKAIRNLHENGKIPVIAGGTGLYISSLIYNMDFSNATFDQEYRNNLLKLNEEKGSTYLHALLKKIDPDSAEIIHPNNFKRVIRALEVHRSTGSTIKKFAKDLYPSPKYDVLLFCLHRERNLLYDRINLRVEIMMEAGLVDEVVRLTEIGLDENHKAMKGIGYKEVLEHLSWKIDKEEMIYRIKLNSRHYAKRQLTWLRRYREAVWIDANGSEEEILNNLLIKTKDFVRQT